MKKIVYKYRMKCLTKKIICESARLCKNSYSTFEMLEEDFYYIKSEETGLDCFIRGTGDITWVVFRGTETDKLNDLCTDAFTWRVSPNFLPSKCKVHAGFLNQYGGNRSSITEVISTLNNPTVVCTGHSLGGGLATLCALDLEQNFGVDVETYCVTFGSPRVGGSHFCKLFDSVIDNSFRFVDVNDPIPRLPFKMWGFHHVKGCYTTSPEGFKPDLEQVESSSYACCSVEDHGIELYEAALNFDA